MMNDSDVDYANLDDPEQATGNCAKDFCINGIEAPAPCCTPYCENRFCLWCCLPVARTGLKSMGRQRNRGPLMLVLSFLSVIQIALAVVGACGLSKGETTLKHTNWGYSDVEHGTVYMGLSYISVEINSDDTPDPMEDLFPSGVYKWDEFCGIAAELNMTSSVENSCKECDDATSALTTSAIFGVVGKFTQLTTDLTRSTRKEDVPCQKVVGTIVPFFSTISTLYAIMLFNHACFGTAVVEEFDFKKHHGPGSICFIVITIMSLPDIIGHLVVPVPDEVLLRYSKLDADTVQN